MRVELLKVTDSQGDGHNERFKLQAEDYAEVFDTLTDAMQFADRQGMAVSGPLAFGYRLGGMIVEYSEAHIDQRDLVFEGLHEGTDDAWQHAGSDVAQLIRDWADRR